MATARKKAALPAKKTAAAAPAPGPTQWWVEIAPIRKGGGGEVRRMGPFASERTAERCESGVMINMDHGRFYTRIASGKS